MQAKRPSSQDRRWFRILMATILVCVALSIGSLVGVMARTFTPATKEVYNPETRQMELVPIKTAIDPWELIKGLTPLDRKINILILGSDYNYANGKRVNDEEAGTRSRTDTIMLASLDPMNQTVSLLSIPRDTYALLSGYHYDKINAAMTYGGVELVKSTVTDLTGVPIDYYMALKVDGLVNSVDVLGGLRIYVEKDMYYVDETAHLGINIHKGWKEAMNGEQAHQYIRFRKDELGDIGRVQRQQKFIRAVVDKLLQPTSWLKLPSLIAHLNENIETDIPQSTIGQIARFGAGIDKEKIRMVMLPGTFATYSGISYWQPNADQSRKVISDLFPESSLALDLPDAPELDPENPLSQYRISVWNATGDLRTGREVVRRLKEAGWNVWAVRKAPHDTTTTKVIAQNGRSDILPQLKDTLGFKAESVNASVGELITDFTVLIGPDLVKHYAKTLTDEDWTRAQKQPLPTSPAVRQRRIPTRQPAVNVPQQVPTRRQNLSASSQATVSSAPTRTLSESTSKNLTLEPQLPQSARQPQKAVPPPPAQNEVELNLSDPLYN